jgi:hypothetical protein
MNASGPFRRTSSALSQRSALDPGLEHASKQARQQRAERPDHEQEQRQRTPLRPHDVGRAHPPQRLRREFHQPAVRQPGVPVVDVLRGDARKLPMRVGLLRAVDQAHRFQRPFVTRDLADFVHAARQAVVRVAARSGRRGVLAGPCVTVQHGSEPGSELRPARVVLGRQLQVLGCFRVFAGVRAFEKASSAERGESSPLTSSAGAVLTWTAGAGAPAALGCCFG